METIVQNVWTRSKLLIKGLIIIFLILLLQIPAHLVRELIEEREDRQRQAIAEVSERWAGRQTVSGPVLVLPYWKPLHAPAANQTREKDYAYFLPDEITVDSEVNPQEKHRGIYKVMLYTSSIRMTGRFDTVSVERLNILPENVLWNEAFIKLPLSDNKGLNEEFSLKWNEESLSLFPQATNDRTMDNALQAPLKIEGPKDLDKVTFSANFQLNGSQQLLFTPTGKSTTVTLRSKWPHPSFTGNTLPQQTVVNKEGFSATWKSASHRRNFPQQWAGPAYVLASYNHDVVRPYERVTEDHHNINASSFGANLYIPVSGYQKTLRSVKYASLCILLTFAAFFLIEINNKKSVHPFQYGLIGLALVLFYTLLLSFSEYIGFNLSYAAASLFTIGLIGWFVKDVLGSGRLAVLLSTVLVLLYVYVFTILQLQDFSLLFGSLGLFFTLAVIMHFSKKIQW